MIGLSDRDKIILATTKDSDMPIISGDKFLGNKDYTKGGKYVLVGTCEATLTNTMRHLPEKSRGTAKLEDAKCPLSENVRSRKL